MRRPGNACSWVWYPQKEVCSDTRAHSGRLGGGSTTPWRSGEASPNRQENP